MFIKSAVCAIAICLASGAALAQPAPLPAGPVAGLGPIMPPHEISKILRVNGLVPQATPVRNGEAYQVRAIDRRGFQVRVAIDARYGDILMVRPIAVVPPGAYGPRPHGPPPGYEDDLPTAAIGGYPPYPGMGPSPGHAAALAPAKPPIPRPKPAAKPATAAVAPAAPPETPPAGAASSDSPPSTPAQPSAPAPAAANPPSTTPAMPPVTPLE
ncbi:MAG: PepSY domain-containing protein [Hyphomicrobiales bacterium]|nr:PepSY domain-containing protein [Hyphomicrobiales bacterium]MBV8826098.1 PepSY domain-containing protein [Hyphomicrobiales bacterium]MBV9426456.1 PepSY domain-containing protein [Bradyrhizobiaceae bacterium]